MSKTATRHIVILKRLGIAASSSTVAVVAVFAAAEKAVVDRILQRAATAAHDIYYT